MKPPVFQYQRAETADHAVALLAEFGEDARILAGGQSLVPLLNLRLANPSHLVDISKTPDLLGFEEFDAGLLVRASMRYCEAERNPIVGSRFPVIRDAIGMVGHDHIRNRGTVVGSLAHNDPAAEFPAVALVCEATLNLRSTRGVREVSAAEFVGSAYTTAAAADELVESVFFPARPSGTGEAVVEYARRPGDFAIAGIACRLASNEQGLITECRLASFSCGPSAGRHEAAEASAIGQIGESSVFGEIGDLVAGELRDIEAQPSPYRHRLVRYLVTESLRKAWHEAAPTELTRQ